MDNHAISDAMTESTPLLLPHEGLPTPDTPLGATPKTGPSSKHILTILFVVVFLQVSSEQLMETPRTRIVESILCYVYFEKEDPTKILLGRDAIAPGAVNGVAESWCKTDAVQSGVANLGAYQQVLDGLWSLLLALPFGWAADHVGRRPFLLSGFASSIARWAWFLYICWSWPTYDIHWTLLSSLNGLFAGSTSVIYTLIFVVISDVTPQTEQANAFFRIGAASLFPLLLAPPLAAWAMEISPWIPSFGGLALSCAAFAFLLFIPETLDKSALPSSPGDSDAIAPNNASMPNTGNGSRISSADSLRPSPKSVRLARRFYDRLQRAKEFASRHWNVAIILLPFTEHMLIGGTTQLQVQFLSRRLGLAISQTTLFLSFRAGCSIVLFLVLLPRLSMYMTTVWKHSSPSKDLHLARASLMLQAVGWISTGLSNNVLLVTISMAVSTLGSGTALFLRSLASLLVPSNRLGTMFSIISIIDMIGSMLGAPILAALFSWGMRTSDFWLGSPFYLIGLFSALLAVLLWTIRIG